MKSIKITGSRKKMFGNRWYRQMTNQVVRRSWVEIESLICFIKTALNVWWSTGRAPADQPKDCRFKSLLESPGYTFEQRCLIWLLQPRSHLRETLHGCRVCLCWVIKTIVHSFIYSFIQSTQSNTHLIFVYLNIRHRVINCDKRLNMYSLWI